jgi:hypothetical protein
MRCPAALPAEKPCIINELSYKFKVPSPGYLAEMAGLFTILPAFALFIVFYSHSLILPKSYHQLSYDIKKTLLYQELAQPGPNFQF